MENIRFLILSSNSYVEPRVDEYGELNYYLGALHYDTIVWLLNGEVPVKAYKTLTSNNIYCKIYRYNGLYVVESADLQELSGFKCKLTLKINSYERSVVDNYTFPFVLSEVVKVREGDRISVWLNGHEVYIFPVKEECIIDLRFDCFQQRSEGRQLIKIKVFYQDLEAKQAVLFAD